MGFGKRSVDIVYCKWNLKNPVYTGAVVIRKHERPSYKLKYKKAIPLEEMELVPDAHEAIISKEEFDRVQQIRKGAEFPILIKQ